MEDDERKRWVNAKRSSRAKPRLMMSKPIRRRAAKRKANRTICGLYLDCGASANSGRVRSHAIVAAMPSGRLKRGGPRSAKVGSIGVG